MAKKEDSNDPILNWLKEQQQSAEMRKKFPNEGVSIDPWTDPSTLPLQLMGNKAVTAGTSKLLGGLGSIGQKLLQLLGKRGAQATTKAAPKLLGSPEGEAAASKFGESWDKALKGLKEHEAMGGEGSPTEALERMYGKPGEMLEPGAGLGTARLNPLLPRLAGTAKNVITGSTPLMVRGELQKLTAPAGEAPKLSKTEVKGEVPPGDAKELLGTLQKSMGSKPEAKGLRAGIQEAKKGKKGYLKGKEGAQDQAVLSGLIRKMFPGIKDEDIAQLLADTLGGVQIKGGKKFTPGSKSKPKKDESKEISGVPGESGEDSLTVDKEDRTS